VGDQKDWKYDPWGGTIEEGRIFGRGANDMKCGTTASIFTYAYLYRIRNQLNGKLTLTCVSDEETFGPWGARYLLKHHPEVHGDTCLNGEPSGQETRFGEKGVLWLAFNIKTRGAHGAYPHISKSATKIASQLMLELDDALDKMEVSVPPNIRQTLEGKEETIDKSFGQGASKVLHKITINFGTIQGGLKINMIPGEVKIEADIRLPIGQDKESVLAEINKVINKYPEVSYIELNHTPPSHCDPEGEMLNYLHKNIQQVTGHTATALIGLGGTDARLWRYQNIPAYVYGPYARNMGSKDEYVEVEEFIDVVKVHVLSAYDYLSKPI
jgi:succinyl-diaminopimelate desuccinylase